MSDMLHDSDKQDAGQRQDNSAVDAAKLVRRLIQNADKLIIGAGSGLSTADGHVYGGEWFQQNFGDFAEKYGYTDAYSAGFHPFATPEEKWAYWSRHIDHFRYLQGPGQVYADVKQLTELLKPGAEYFVLTTNVDHMFQRAGFDEQRLFYTQGDYGEWQCSVPCSQDLYGNEEQVKALVAAQQDMRVPSDLVPHCPKCGAEMETHLRADQRFVQDAAWYEMAQRWSEFSAGIAPGERSVHLELGVGMNTPGIIKYPFWRAVYEDPNAVLVTVGLDTGVPQEIADKSVVLRGDIGVVLRELSGQ